MPDDEGKSRYDETIQSMAEDCSTCYAIIDELLEQVYEAAGELRFYKLREHEDIRQILIDIEAIHRVRRLIRDMIDPREDEDEGPPTEQSPGLARPTATIAELRRGRDDLRRDDG